MVVGRARDQASAGALTEPTCPPTHPPTRPPDLPTNPLTYLQSGPTQSTRQQFDAILLYRLALLSVVWFGAAGSYYGSVFAKFDLYIGNEYITDLMCESPIHSFVGARAFSPPPVLTSLSCLPRLFVATDASALPMPRFIYPKLLHAHPSTHPST